MSGVEVAPAPPDPAFSPHAPAGGSVSGLGLRTTDPAGNEWERRPPPSPSLSSVESRIVRGREGAGSWGPLAARVGRDCRGHCGVGEPTAKLCGAGGRPVRPPQTASGEQMRLRKPRSGCSAAKPASSLLRFRPWSLRGGGAGGEGYSGLRSKAGKEQKPEANFQNSSQSQEKMETFSFLRTTSFSTLPIGLNLSSDATCWLSGHKYLLKNILMYATDDHGHMPTNTRH